MSILNLAGKAAPLAALLAVSFISNAFAATPSVSGASLPAETQILDAKLNSWTLSSGVVYENSKTAGFTAQVLSVLYKDGLIYQEIAGDLWWYWNGSTWVSASDPRAPSASGTSFTSSASLVDAAKNIWALSGGVVYENGAPAGFSGSVIDLYYKNGLIYQESASDLWWDWNGSTWVSVSNPTAPTPSPSPKPSPSATASPRPSPSPSATASPKPVGSPTIDCPNGFSTSGSCGVATSYPGGEPFSIVANGGAHLSGSSLILQPTGVVHNPNSFMYQKKVNAQAFVTSFQFVMNGWNIAFTLNNTTVNPYGFNGSNFSSGAGCEGGFYQAYQTTPPNNVFALDFEAHNRMTPDAFTYSNVQIYQQGQDPCLEGENASGLEPFYYPTNKVSTYPVALDSPGGSQTTYTGHTYSATIINTGTNIVLNMYDVSAGGTCTPTNSPSCFTYTWTGISIPSWVDGTTAWAGFTATTNAPSPTNLTLDRWVYTELTLASEPTFTPTAGTYAGTQSVKISDASPGAIICYNTTGNPSTDGTTGCANGTRYTGAISVTSGQTVYAVAGGSGYGDSAVGSSAYRIGATASQPTFSPASGTYQGDQTVFLTAAQGSIICYSTSGTPETNGAKGCASGTLYTGPITVSSNETLYATAGGTGFTNSSVGESTYRINAYASTDGGKLYAPANSPTFSPLPGTYSGAQSVKLSTTTPNAYICYVVSVTAPALLPEPNSVGGCSVGTLYSGPVAVTSTETVYAVAGTKMGSYLAGSGAPSSVISGSYSIGGH